MSLMTLHFGYKFIAHLTCPPHRLKLVSKMKRYRTNVFWMTPLLCDGLVVVIRAKILQWSGSAHPSFPCRIEINSCRFYVHRFC